jgi:hypothetical protein
MDYISVAGDCLLLAETIIRSLPDCNSLNGINSLSSNSLATTTSSRHNLPPTFTKTREVIKFINSLGKGDFETMAAQQKIDMSKLEHLTNVEVHQAFMREAIAMVSFVPIFLLPTSV